MRNIIIFETSTWKNYLPITLAHPVFELRIGNFTNLERYQAVFKDANVGLISRAYFNQILKETHLLRVNEDLFGLEGEILFMNGSIHPPNNFSEVVDAAPEESIFLAAGKVLGFKTSKNIAEKVEILTKIPSENDLLRILVREAKAVDVKLDMLNYIWDLVNQNPTFIEEDFKGLYSSKRAGIVDDGVYFYNKDFVHIGKTAKVDSGAILDAREGPIWLSGGVHVHPNTVITGPAYVGWRSEILAGAKIHPGCSIGPQCKIGGEIEQSILLGYSNKSHEGYIGHSYIGEWVNLGALTTTSDLKNNYSEIKVLVDGSNEIPTGHIKIGSFIGDHTKLGIGTLLNSGTVIGFSANLFGGGMCPKYVPSFSWGTKDELVEYKLDKAIETAEVVLPRRGKKLSNNQRDIFKIIYNNTKTDRFDRNIFLGKELVK
ncbi:hypothetical protein JXI42_05540 [bacterium]|nr:hypothetical protein [bacterium]